MRIARFLALLAVCILATTGASMADDYPSKPIHMIVGYPPGGSTDIAARLLSEELSKQMGVTVLVENRAGASGIVGMSAVVQAPPDGYTLLFGASAELAISKAIGREMPYDPLKNLTPISLVADVPFMLVVNPSVPANSVQELIALAKKRPHELNFGSFGQGTSNHLVTELFKARTGIDVVHVPFKGSAPAMTALLGGQVQFAFDTVPVVVPHVEGGKLRALAFARTERSPLLPNVPTMDEAGVPGFVGGTWLGVLAPAGTSQAVVDRLASEIGKAVQVPALKKVFVERGYVPVGNKPDEFKTFMQAEVKKWSEVADRASIKVK